MHRPSAPISGLPPTHYRNLQGAPLPVTPLAFLSHLIWRRFRYRFLAAIFCTIGGIGFMSLEPVFLGRTIEALRLKIYQDHWGLAVWRPFGMVAVAWLISGAFNRLGEIVDLFTVPVVRQEIQLYLFSWLLDHAPDYFHRNYAGQLAAKIKQAGQSAVTILNLTTADIVRVIAAIVISIIIVGINHPAMGLFVLLWTPLYLGMALLLARSRQELSARFQNHVSASTGLLVDLASNADLIRSFAKGPQENRNLMTSLDAERDSAALLRRHGVMMNFALFTSMQLFQIALIAAALYMAVHGRMVVGDTVMMVSLSVLLMNNIQGAASRMLDLIEQFGQLSASLDTILVPHEITDQPAAVPLAVGRGAIEFDHVRFAHADGRTVFDDLCLSIPAGQKLGLVGPSGAGKSTLVKLLRRHHEPLAGRILIDNQDIASVTRLSLNEAIAETPQQPSLFHRSIRDNIAYAAGQADAETIMRCARDAHAHDFITGRANSYDALVGEQGVQLSGGERQRIAIARALLKDAPILVLDEATASLDSETEHHIQQALQGLFKGRTVIAIAHRLSTISSMDRILFLENGRIAEDGTHAELLALGGRYATLWLRQAGGFV